MKRTRFCVRFVSDRSASCEDSSAKKKALICLRDKDPDMKKDPEGNPVLAWIETSLEMEDILAIDGVEDCIKASQQPEEGE